ncbi:MAG: hypothetical protein WHT08_00915 [Bryobacteraceae bacterium]
MTTRRHFLALLAAPWAGSRRSDTPAARAVVYRIDAVIVLFGRALFTRTGVGEGILFHEESGRLGPEACLRMAFAGGSFPERARGLNRFGYFSEVVKTPAGAPPESSYFGFMTRSEEKSVAEAARSLDASGNPVHVSAIHGEICGSRHRARVAILPLAQDACWAVWRNCLHTVARLLMQIPAGEGGTEREAPGCTFLQTVRQVLLDSEPRGDAPFLYGRNPRRLLWRRNSDRKAAVEFASRRLLAPGGNVMRLDAETVDEATHGKSRFSLWYDPEAHPRLPLRIELQPRSFLRLRLEAAGADSAPLIAGMEEAFDAWRILPSLSLRAGL